MLVVLHLEWIHDDEYMSARALVDSLAKAHDGTVVEFNATQKHANWPSASIEFKTLEDAEAAYIDYTSGMGDEEEFLSMIEHK